MATNHKEVAVMANRAHGRNGQLKIDATSGALGLALTTVPFLADWSIDGVSDRVDVTCMQDGNKVKLLGFKDFKFSISGFADRDSDIFRVIGDGVPRYFVFCDDTTAPDEKRYWSGLMALDVSSSGGPTKGLSVSITGEASGTIVETFSATEPDPLP
jgi:hypothetical protein